jgi:hypothetical protein
MASREWSSLICPSREANSPRSASTVSHAPRTDSMPGSASDECAEVGGRGWLDATAITYSGGSLSIRSTPPSGASTRAISPGTRA